MKVHLASPRISSSLFLRFFISFLILLTLPVLAISITMNAQIGKMLTGKIQLNIQNMLDNVMDMAENALDDAEKASVLLMENERLKKLAQQRPNMNAVGVADVYLIQDVFEVLADIANSNKNIAKISVYNQEDNYVITSEKRIEPPQSAQNEAWVAAYQKNYGTMQWLETTLLSDMGMEAPVITVVYPLTAYTRLFPGAIAIQIPVSRLTAYMDEGGDGYIMSDTGDRVVTLEGELTLEPESYTKVNSAIFERVGRKDSFVLEAGKRRYLVSYNKSGYNNWYYVSIHDEDRVLSEINGFTRLIIWVVTLLLGLGLVAVYLFSRSFYSPVEKIVKDLKTHSGVAAQNKNEWKFIEDALREMKQQDKKLEELTAEQRKSEKTMMLKQIVLDGVSSWSDYEAVFPYRYYSVASIEPDCAEEFHSRYSVEQCAYLLSLALKVAEKLVNAQIGFRASGFVQENGIILVMNSETCNVEGYAGLTQAVHTEMERIFGLSITVAAGSIVEAGSVSESLESARRNAGRRFFVGDGQVILPCADGPAEEIRACAEEGAVFSVLSGKDPARAAALVEELMGQFAPPANQNYETAMQQCLVMLISINKYMQAKKIPVQAILRNGENMYGDILKCKTLQKAGGYILGICERVIQYQMISGVQDSFVQKMMNYVHESYKTDIDVYAMAKDLNISYSQLRRLFIEHTGQNIVAYTNQLRIQEAKRLLTETDSTMLEISTELGYNTDQSFNRYFKKLEGMTPGEYRKLFGKRGQ